MIMPGERSDATILHDFGSGEWEEMIWATKSPVPQPTSSMCVADEKGTVLFATDVMAFAPWIEALSSGNFLLQAAPQIDHRSGGASAGMAILNSQFGFWE